MTLDLIKKITNGWCKTTHKPFALALESFNSGRKYENNRNITRHYSNRNIVIYINVFDWGVSNEMYRSRKDADKNAGDRNRYLCIKTHISSSQWDRYKNNKNG